MKLFALKREKINLNFILQRFLILILDIQFSMTNNKIGCHNYKEI